MTSVAEASAAMSSTGVSRCAAASALPGSSLPLVASRASCARTSSIACAARPATASVSSTRCPASAATWAIPAPIVPGADHGDRGRHVEASHRRSCRPDGPVAGLSRKQIQRRTVLGGLINKYERAA
jgi:hypothetical protein